MAGVAAIYDKVLTREETGQASIGWQRGVYPTESTAREAILRDDLFVGELAGRLVAAAVINHRQMPPYADVEWKTVAEGREVMVLHTLVVDPDFGGRGIATRFVDYYERFAASSGCCDLRMDTQAKNRCARSLYRKLGYEEIGTVECEFNGIEGISLVLLEKTLA